MYYELYVDSLLLVNFVMNLYLLLLVSQSTLCGTTPVRLLLGAGVGALLYLIPFVGIGSVPLRLLVGIAGSILGMLLITFRIRSVRSFLQILEKLLYFSFLMGGLLLLAAQKIPFFTAVLTKIAGLLGAGAVAYLFLAFRQRQ